MKNSDINIRDPFILVYNGMYYMYGTRAANFGYKTEGFDVYKSTDLENWSEPVQVFYSSKFGFNGGANWAPEVHIFNGVFYMFATFTQPNGLRGTYILKSNSPEGEFVPVSGEAVTPSSWECLDGTLYVENGVPYCIFCHEHTQILDGTICSMPLKSDLSAPAGEPKEFFAASSFLKREASESCHNVTDGPFLFKKENGKLIMIWSTCENGYLQCVAQSDNGSVYGEWHHIDPIFTDNGGHGMIFKDLNGKLRLTLHCPNTQTLERPVFFELIETEESVKINKSHWKTEVTR